MSLFESITLALLVAVAYGLFSLIRLVDAFYRAWLRANQR